MNYNRVILGGRLVRDPSLKHLSTLMSVCEFTLAYNRKHKDKPDTASYFEAKAFGKTAENIHQYFRKGDEILIEGRLEQETWLRKDSTKASKTVVNIDTFQFVGKRGDGPAPQARSSRGDDASPPIPDDPDIPF